MWVKVNKLPEHITLSELVRLSVECWNGLLLLLIVMIMVISDRMDRRRYGSSGANVFMYTKELILFYSGAFVYELCDILIIAFSGVRTGVSRGVVSFAAFFLCLSAEFLALIFLHIVRKLVTDNQGGKKLERYIAVFQYLQIPAVIMILITPVTGVVYRVDENNECIRCEGYYIWQVFSVISFIVIVTVLLKKWPRMKIFKGHVILIMAVFVVLFVAGSQITEISIMSFMVIFLSVLLFFQYEIIKTRAVIKNQNRLEHTKARLAESRLTMMTAQIKPHYIYNSMNVIRELCYSDPELAAETISHFSGYLQGKIEAFSGNGLTSFEKELDLVNEYIAIEYADENKKFRVGYDLKCTGFDIPALTVQPLVENAVKHGIDRYSEKSFVCISSFEEEENIIITVTDNATAEKGDDSLFAAKRGTGLNNVAERLKLICRGSLDIDHDENGTYAKIIIPKG